MLYPLVRAKSFVLAGTSGVNVNALGFVYESEESLGSSRTRVSAGPLFSHVAATTLDPNTGAVESTETTTRSPLLFDYTASDHGAVGASTLRLWLLRPTFALLTVAHSHDEQVLTSTVSLFPLPLIGPAVRRTRTDYVASGKVEVSGVVAYPLGYFYYRRQVKERGLVPLLVGDHAPVQPRVPRSGSEDAVEDEVVELEVVEAYWRVANASYLKTGDNTYVNVWPVWHYEQILHSWIGDGSEQYVVTHFFRGLYHFEQRLGWSTLSLLWALHPVLSVSQLVYCDAYLQSFTVRPLCHYETDESGAVSAAVAVADRVVWFLCVILVVWTRWCNALRSCCVATVRRCGGL